MPGESWGADHTGDRGDPHASYAWLVCDAASGGVPGKQFRVDCGNGIASLVRRKKRPHGGGLPCGLAEEETRTVDAIVEFVRCRTTDF